MPDSTAPGAAAADEIDDYVPITARPGYQPPPEKALPAPKEARTPPAERKPYKERSRNPYLLMAVFIAIAAVAALVILSGPKEERAPQPTVTAPPGEAQPPPEQPPSNNQSHPGGQQNGTPQPPEDIPNPPATPPTNISPPANQTPPPITPPPANPPGGTPNPSCPDECCSNADCAQGVCVSGKCKECKLNTDCMGIEVCCNNRCAECCSDPNCPTGMSCQDNICVQVKTLPGVSTFLAKEYPGGICTDNGKPILRMFGTSECPHCEWVAGTYDSVVKSYGPRVVAHRWIMDDKDDALTPQAEGSVPASEIDVYYAFNPGYTTPTFVFGCRYYRVGTEYEDEKDLAAEARDFKAVIDKLLSEV